MHKRPPGPGPKSDLTDEELKDILENKARGMDGEAYYKVDENDERIVEGRLGSYGRFKSRHSFFIETSEVRRWYKNGVLHRDNESPAEVYSNGTRVWFLNGHNCRLNPEDPAITFPNGSSEGRIVVYNTEEQCFKTLTIWTQGAPNDCFQMEKVYTGVAY